MSTDLNQTNQPRKPTKYVLPAILILGLSIFFLSGAHEFLTWQAVGAHYAYLNGFVGEHLWLSYLIFILGYAVVVAFSLPIALPLTLTGGALLGWPAVILVICGATAGAGVVFIAARSFFADLLRARAGPFMARLEAGFSRNSFSYLLALRLIPAAPFWVVNIVPALTNMRLGKFLLATFIGISPGTAVFISVGRGFDHILATGQTPDLDVLTSAPIIIPLVGLGVLALLPVVVRRMTDGQRDLSQ
jgi:uncharacterized membrane protein YdjX (TVP38/TMEM64 family)